MNHRFVLLLCSLLTLPTMTYSQQSATASAATPSKIPGTLETHPNWAAAARPADVDTVEHLVDAVYDVISGPAGKARDWERFRSLFLPDGRLAVIHGSMNSAGEPQKEDVIYLTLDDFIERDEPYFATHGFFENRIANRVEEFGNLVNVWSSYQSRHAAEDSKPFARGVNSMQIVHARGRFWFSSIIWDAERPGLTLPDKYLKP
jgi:hypothetical protein